ncbi:uncharacterized protein ISCGN_016185 [Ixodes scapularis]
MHYICLRRFLAAGLTLRMVTFNFLVGRSTACRVVSDVCDALWDILQPVYLTCPQTADEWLRVAADFEERWNFPHSLGAIDGKHVTVECPPKSGSLDRNYKGTFSKSMLAVSDAHYRFLYVELGHHGSESDGGIFSRCKLQERLLQGQMGMPQDQNVGIEGPLPYIVGDEAFPLKTYMMRPFSRKALQKDPAPPPGADPDAAAAARKAEVREQRIFNYRLSRARRVVETAFGILAQKWRILRRPFRANDQNINRIIAACVALHNFMLKQSAVSAASYCPVGLADSEDWEGRVKDGSWRSDKPKGGALAATPPVGCNPNQYARTMRSKLSHHFLNAGAVTWQDDRISFTPK